MNRRTLLRCAALSTILLVSSATFASAQATSVVIGSGAIAASQGETRLTATIGQSAIGLTAATSAEASQGFWYSRTTAPSFVLEELQNSSALALTSAPNPFSRSTTLSFSVPERGHVSLVLYNAVGEQVRTVVEGDRDAGPASEVVDMTGLPSGQYTAVVRMGGRHGTTSLLLVD
jgi:hypothetical protein